MLRYLALIVAAAFGPGITPGSAEEAARLPSIALLSLHPTLGTPTGFPIAPDFVPHIPRRAGATRAADSTDLGRSIGTKTPTAPDQPDEDDDEDDPTPVKPGSLPTSFVKVPTPVPMLKNRSLGPHLKPDATYELNDRTTIGIISQLDGLRASTVMSTLGRAQLLPSSIRTTSTPAHSMRSRDLGLGATLEFKLGR